jgi:hypothetical protein
MHSPKDGLVLGSLGAVREIASRKWWERVTDKDGQGIIRLTTPLVTGGKLYRARDPVLKREVAIKVSPSFVLQDPDRLRRFENEAQAAAALNHPTFLPFTALASSRVRHI